MPDEYGSTAMSFSGSNATGVGSPDAPAAISHACLELEDLLELRELLLRVFDDRHQRAQA